MYNILHITTHMGGGVGKTLADLCLNFRNSQIFKHKILCIEQPKNRHFIDACLKEDIEVIISDDYTMLNDEIKKSDIVQISWWHHPKMVKYLVNFPNIETRIIIWLHISGCNYPSVPFEFLRKANRIFFTSQYSYDNPCFSKKQIEYLKNKSDIIYGCGDMSSTNIKKMYKKSKKTFNIGYVGTLDYSKLYPNFIQLCSKISIPNVKFILVGDNSTENKLKLEIEKNNLTDRFVFKGYVTDIYKELNQFDIFGYPLNPYHYGTTENAILEAMISRLPVVAFNQCAEKYLINNMETGMLANNEDEYVKCIEYLYRNPSERIRLGKNSEEYVLSEFSTQKKIEKIEKAYNDVLKMPPKIFEFKSIFGLNPSEWFLSCLGKEFDYFNRLYKLVMLNNFDELNQYNVKLKECESIFKSHSKSSINHFAEYYKDEKFINYLKSVINI